MSIILRRIIASGALLAMILSALLSLSTVAEAHSTPGSSIETVNTATGPAAGWTAGQSLSEEDPAPPYHCKDGQGGQCAPAYLFSESAKGRSADARDQARFPRFGLSIPRGFVAPDIPPPKSV